MTITFKITKEVDGKKYLHEQWEEDSETGKRNGEYKEWNIDGVLVTVSEYKNGSIIKEKLLDPVEESQELTVKEFKEKYRCESYEKWKNDNKQDKFSTRWSCTEWYPNEWKKFKMQWSEEHSSAGLIKIGNCDMWWENGQKSKKCNYNSSGHLDGVLLKWWENGQKWVEFTYKDGKLNGEYKRWDNEILVKISEYKDDFLLKEKLWDRTKCVWNCQEWFPRKPNQEEKLKREWSENKDGKKVGKYIKWDSLEDGGHKRIECNYSSSGNEKYDGEYKEYYWESGELAFICHYKDGKEHGKYTNWSRDGKKYLERNYKDGKSHGEYKQWNRDILINISEHEDEQLLKEKLWNLTDNIYTCKKWFPPSSCGNGEKQLKCSWTENKDGQKVGKYTKWYSPEDGGHKYKECNYFESENYDGEYKSWWANGNKRVECSYKDGRKVGEYESWYTNGKLFKRDNYSSSGNGRKHGECKVWDSDGIFSDITEYKDGKMNGEYKCWSKDGTLVDISEYKDDCLIKEKLWRNKILVWTCKEWFPASSEKEKQLKCSWTENEDGERVGKYEKWYSPEDGGHKYIECNYSGDGKLDGEYKQYWENGKIYYICHYSSSKSGEKHGKYASWSKDGTNVNETNYKDGKKHGEYKRWDAGILVDISEYKDGWLLKEKLWEKKTLVWTCREWFLLSSRKLKCSWTENKDGKKVGKYTEWFSPEDGGHKSIERNYSNTGSEKFVGEYRVWWENGNKHVEYNYSSSGSGKYDGKCEKWWKNGESYIEDWWENGNIKDNISKEKPSTPAIPYHERLTEIAKNNKNYVRLPPLSSKNDRIIFMQKEQILSFSFSSQPRESNKPFIFDIMIKDKSKSTGLLHHKVVVDCEEQFKLVEKFIEQV